MIFSAQRILGRDDEFCALFEQSAQQGITSIEALKRALDQPEVKLTIHDFALARRGNKAVSDRVTDLLVGALVVALDREDIENLNEALYKIPKTVEKFAERYLLSYERVKSFDFSRQILLMEESVKSVLEMVQAFRSGAGVQEITRLDARIQRLEAEADQVVLKLLEKVFRPDEPTLNGIILKDLVELNEKVVDRCRDASGVIARIVLKTS